MNCSLSGSSVHGILQARILEWVSISFSRGSFPPRDWTQVSCIAGRFFTVWTTRKVLVVLLLSRVWLFASPWTAARHASLSITNSWSLLKLMSVESVMPSNYLIFIPFSRLQSFPASGSFQMSQFFTSGGQICWTCFFSLWTPKLNALGLPRYVIRTCGMWFESPRRDFLSSMCAMPCLPRVFSMELMLDGYITVQLELFL